ncbi:MAG: hypothetical protein IJ955_11095 [Oscillospiraceae bacterium]|nr:hypothetical protein [Oscillospiraceae bacterium]
MECQLEAADEAIEYQFLGNLILAIRIVQTVNEAVSGQYQRYVEVVVEFAEQFIHSIHHPVATHITTEERH